MLGPAEDVDPDNFTVKNSVTGKAHNKLMHPMKKHMEASLGKQMGIEIAKTQQFLENDRKVLRFYVLHNDTDLYGEPRPFVMQYYLADDTVSFSEVKDQNNSRDHFATLLKRYFPKNIHLTALDIIVEPFPLDPRFQGSIAKERRRFDSRD